MADIQSSLRRLQESIRGLSDASALVGATGAISVHSQERENGGIYDDDGGGGGGGGVTSPVGAGSSSTRGSSSSTRRSRPGSSTSKSSSTDKYRQYQHQQHFDGDDDGDARSSLGGRLEKQQQQEAVPSASFLSSIPRDLRESAEMRAARELEDLRMEKESLDVMKQQLAAVHQLRIDLQRKDSVIQSLQLKVQEGESARDREGRLDAHCHLLEKRCSYLESTNGEYAERLGALDQESRSRVDGLKREKDDLKRQLRDSESELEAERRRFEGAAAAHRRELAAALAEGADARGLAGGLKDSLEEASAQANRRHGRWAEMEKLLTTQLEETRTGLARAERRAVATADIRRRDAEAAAAAAAALSAHLEAVCGRASGGGADERRKLGVGEEGAGQDSTEAFVELSGRWCGNELLALTWVEVSKALEALDAAQAGHRTAVGRLRDSNRQVARQQEETSSANQVVDDLRQELSRLRGVEARLQSTAAQLKATRERARGQRVHVDAAWSQLSSIGAVSPDGLENSNADDKDNSELFPGRIGCAAGESGSGAAVAEGGSMAAAGLGDEARLSEIPRGIRRLVSEWSDRGKGLETLTRRLREEGVRRDEERAELETAAAVAKDEAEARGEEVARLVVDFETRAACAEAGMDEKVAKVQADAVADANLRVSAAEEEASRKVAAVTADAGRQVAEAVETAERKVKEAAAVAEERVALARGGAAGKEEEADRRVSDAEEALAAARDSETAAVALSRSAVERQLSAEAALKILGRFVGPLHRLCLELREQKRFLSRSYRRDAPLQAELFSVAAAVTGKDYWCLLSGTTDIIASPNNNAATTRRWQRAPSGCSGRRLLYDGACVGEDCLDGDDDVAAVRVPPSLRAVVIAVVAANRLAAFAEASSAARRAYLDGSSVGGPAAAGATAGEGGSGGRQHRYQQPQQQQQQPRQCRTGGDTDTRYLARAGGIRSLPVLPPWCCGKRRRVLRLPAADDLEELPDGQALETVLARLLVFGTGDEGDADGEEEVGGGNVRAEPMHGNVSSGGGGAGGVLNIEALWGGGGARVGDLLYHLIRGRKDHMTGVKERGLALDPRLPPPSRLWHPLTADGSESLASLGVHPRRSGAVTFGSHGSGSGGGDHRRGGWRVKLGRTVRLELERSVWLGEGPGQPGSLHLRDIRKALAALARELNVSEGKRLEVEEALRSAGGGVGITELEESADVLRRRVELLEEEASAKPVVDHEAFAALGEEMKAATAVGARLREQVGRLEEALSSARKEVAEASAASERARAGRDEAEARVGRLDAAKLETAREVEQLKAFAIRANLEREECLERERAVARQRVDQALDEPAVIGGGNTGPDLLYIPPPAVATPTTCGRRLDAGGLTRGSGDGREGGAVSAREGSTSPPLSARRQRRSSDEDHVELWDRRAHADQHQQRQQQRQQQQEQEQLQMRQRLVQSQEELRSCRKEEERSRARCSQLETRLAETRDCLEEQKGVTASMRRAAARAHDDAEAARKQVEDTKARMSRQEFECRRQVSLLEARLLETGVRNSRRRDLLQLQACAQEDLVKALREPVLPSTCGDTVVSDVSDHSLRAEDVERPAAAAASDDEWQSSR